MARSITDSNFRIFAENDCIHVMNATTHLEGNNPFDLFQKLLQRETIDSGHAFYLGYEMCKAITALTLGKNYTQDQALRWGYLTRPEIAHRSRPDERP
jgi:hypothetical protein